MRTFNKRRIGWVIADQLDTMPLWPRIDTRVGGISLARLHWIIPRINNDPESGFHYEVYRPWGRYDGLVFLKSMGEKAHGLAMRYERRDKPIIFDANVNYYSATGVEHYRGMLPTYEQQQDAIAMTSVANAVIADSNYIAEQCQSYNEDVTWIADNIEVGRISAVCERSKSQSRTLVWCGEAIKLFELLLIEEPLRRFASDLRLIVVTNDLSTIALWKSEYRTRLMRLLRDLDATVETFTNLEALFKIYQQADVVLSPRFLDNSYNLGHTEWKITLGMACGCIAMASPVPSYSLVRDLAQKEVVVLCETQDEWTAGFEELLSQQISGGLRQAARCVVDQHYSAQVLAKKHVKLMKRVFNDQDSHLT
jgi:glycosyltransferase involved in cell wall biosynthesis